jgi:hypothetical protein
MFKTLPLAGFQNMIQKKVLYTEPYYWIKRAGKTQRATFHKTKTKIHGTTQGYIQLKT